MEVPYNIRNIAHEREPYLKPIEHACSCIKRALLGSIMEVPCAFMEGPRKLFLVLCYEITYGVATVSRIDYILGLLCIIPSLL